MLSGFAAWLPPHADPGLAGVWGADFRALVPSLLSLVGSCRRFPPAPGPVALACPAASIQQASQVRPRPAPSVPCVLETLGLGLSTSNPFCQPRPLGPSDCHRVPRAHAGRAAGGSSRGQVTVALLGRFFIGTSVSTFSFRIHEEREILGLDPRTTYNRFCGDQEEQCEQPTHWKVAY